MELSSGWSLQTPTAGKAPAWLILAWGSASQMLSRVHQKEAAQFHSFWSKLSIRFCKLNYQRGHESLACCAR